MLSANLIVEARRRAGLSQRELALRLDKRQTEIARWERGHVVPSLERLRDVIAACGLELTMGLTVADDSYSAPITSALRLSAGERLVRSLAAAARGRRARALAAGEPAPATLDVLGVLEALEDAHVLYVLAGEIAEVLHGSPLMPTAGVITIVPRAGERARLDSALDVMQARALSEPRARVIDTPEHWQLSAHGVELVIAPAPIGTRGYDDLHRDASTIQLAANLHSQVASLIDLVRMAEASTDAHDRARVPALRATLELVSAAEDAAAA